MKLPRSDDAGRHELLALVLLLGFGAVFYLYMWNPRRLELAELAQRVEHAERANVLAETRPGDLEALREDLALGERQFRMLERLVPNDGEVAAIYEAIATETQSLGLELVNAIPAEPVPDSAGYFLRQLWAMQVEGEYHDVGQLLTRVAGFPRIVRPRVEEIMPSRVTNSGRQLVLARLNLETFVLASEGLVPPEGGSCACPNPPWRRLSRACS